MSHQVVRFRTASEYTDGSKSGKPVSDRLDTWEAAERIRNQLREEDPDSYYNIIYRTTVKLYNILP